MSKSGRERDRNKESKVQQQKKKKKKNRLIIIITNGEFGEETSSLVGSPALVAAMLSFTIAQICKVFTRITRPGKSIGDGGLVGVEGYLRRTRHVSGRADHGDRVERRVRFEHICVVFGVFAGGKLFVAGLHARVYQVLFSFHVWISLSETGLDDDLPLFALVFARLA